MPYPNNIFWRGLVFLCIPKVANTSIKATLLRDNDHVHKPHRFPYLSPEEIVEHYQDHWRIAFVRNPFDRLVSCYEDKINKDRESFGQFVERIAAEPIEKMNQHWAPQTRELLWRGHWLPDFVGRFEVLQDDWRRLRDVTGVALPALRHENKTERKDYREYFSPRLRRVASAIYKDDLELLNYAY